MLSGRNRFCALLPYAVTARLEETPSRHYRVTTRGGSYGKGGAFRFFPEAVLDTDRLRKGYERKQKIEEVELTNAAELLDGLLGVSARRPGMAVRLPAVIRVIERLEPAGGLEFPVFPASYAGASENDPPIYDLSGVVYGEELGTITGKNKTTVQRPITGAERCTIDSPQSQANRTEVAFIEDADLQPLVPQASASIPRQEGKKGEENVLRLPHRIADFRVRISDKRDEVESAISQFAIGDVSKTTSTDADQHRIRLLGQPW